MVHQRAQFGATSEAPFRMIEEKRPSGRWPGIELEQTRWATPAPNEISVCICTYQRASLRAALESVATQALPNDSRVTIIVIDNDLEPTAKKVVDAVSARSALPIIYRHCPGQNISLARNAALSAVSTRWLAFIDDDEVASPRWLGELLALRDGAHAIFGPCEAVYGEGIPSWIKGADLHSNRVPAGLFPIKTGYTSNVLIDVDFVRRYKLKFDLRLGRSGGEDTMFFREMYQLGATLKYAPEAFVFEEVIPSRTTVKWVASRRYRTGQTYALILRRFSKLRYLSAAWSSPPKIMLCMIMSVCTAPHIVVASFWLMRGIFHIGVLCYALGFSVHQEYRSTPATQKES